MRQARPTLAARRPAAAAALALTVTAVLGGCSSETSDAVPNAEASATTSSSAASGSVAPEEVEPETPVDSAAPTTDSTDEQPLEFSTVMVRSVEVNKVNKGGQANVHVVAGFTDAGALLDVANGCVGHYLQEQRAAFCHVWGTEANYQARDPQDVGDMLCWTHYVGVPLNGGDPIVTTFEPHMLEIDGCPDIAA